ncbi:hypothetical protein KQX54_015041 [Cotesia glomerata]|uniref:Lipocalin/cytosolic fatty-acid binding domain-containing protein n=1 Tax=Cotesia glomerata TaxID=32391 RepID=A0AAV7IV63_COTGL|nr:hypothetical protein KQX54_015041 [Cotesia glomerata]
MHKLHGVMYAYASTENGYDPYQKCEEHHTFLPVDGVAEMLSLRISKKTGNHLKILSEIFENHENSAIYVSSHIPLIGEKNSRYWDVERTPDYGVTWSCENQGNNHAKTVNIYTRKRNPSIDLMNKVQDVYTRIGIQNCYFKRIDQTNCY